MYLLEGFFFILISGECQSYDTDISDSVGGSQITDGTYSYFKEAGKTIFFVFIIIIFYPFFLLNLLKLKKKRNTDGC